MDVGFQFENTRYITDVIADIIYWIGIFFGPFSFINIYNKIQHIFMFGGSEIWSFQEKGIGTNLVTLGCGSIVFLLIVFLLDYRFFDKISYKISFSEKKLPSLTTTDTDVLAEIERVKSKSLELITANKLVMKKLTKSYGNFVAVNQLYVAVEPAECFGLLGVNGAGNFENNISLFLSNINTNTYKISYKLVNIHQKLQRDFSGLFINFIEYLGNFFTFH